MRRRTVSATAMFAVVDGGLYRLKRAASCGKCAFVDKCYSVGRDRMYCPHIPGTESCLALATGTIYEKMPEGGDKLYAIRDGAGGYVQSGKHTTGDRSRATLFSSENAAVAEMRMIAELPEYDEVFIEEISAAELLIGRFDNGKKRKSKGKGA